MKTVDWKFNVKKILHPFVFFFLIYTYSKTRDQTNVGIGRRMVSGVIRVRHVNIHGVQYM